MQSTTHYFNLTFGFDIINDVYLGNIMAESVDDLPRNLQLDDGLMKDFDGGKRGGKHNIFDKIYGTTILQCF